ncbi:hypothetical protein ACFSQU_15440 [Massilia sp. GCM10020059]|uniref:Uncharacterized protein n=1 Tax=Massilia agrisoli TaxID=2892444 RepID=A0ABS8IUJ1_9BURK|nr:hypothetical protein [Massilia agrisoli]MCC6070930.1 hypothetical protein [Massilia agrisoli]
MPKNTLHALTRALRDLHRSLVEVERNNYEREWGPVGDGGQLLQLLTRHPQFDWLRQLSEFIVEIDELADQQVVTDSDVRAIARQANALLSVSEDDGSVFARRYVALLQDHPALVMAHATVRRVLAAP